MFRQLHLKYRDGIKVYQFPASLQSKVNNIQPLSFCSKSWEYLVESTHTMKPRNYLLNEVPVVGNSYFRFELNGLFNFFYTGNYERAFYQFGIDFVQQA